MSEKNLAAVNIPPDKPTEEYSVAERQRDLLDRVKEAGTPDGLPSQADLGRQYGVGQSTISRDLSQISDYVAEALGNRHVLTTASAFDRALQGALDDEEWEAASRIAERRANWIEGRTNGTTPVNDVPDHRDPDRTLDYEIVTADAEDDAEQAVAEAEQ